MADSSALRQRIADGAARAVERATAELVDELKATAPYLTGETYDKLHGEVTSRDATGVSARIDSPTIQGAWVNDGTRPHPIYPVLAKVLRFEVGGQVVFARKVDHPGTTATRWFSDPVSFWPDRVREQFPAAWDG